MQEEQPPVSEISTKPKPFVFVLMPFDEKYDDVYQVAIKDACKDAGAYCERLDEQIFEESMLERIYNQIAKADILVADMSDQNPNVFYEVGYAHALDRRTILIARDERDIPFDLKHYNHIIYNNKLKDLRGQLTRRISWYVENPRSNKQEGIQNLQIFLNEEALRAQRLFSVKVHYIEHYQTYEDPYSGREEEHFRMEYYIKLFFSANNEALSNISTISFTPQVISSQFICSSRAPHKMATSRDLVPIKLPEGQLAHRYEPTCQVEPGGWCQFEWHFTLDGKPVEGSELNCVLRILSDTPSVDYPFTIKSYS